MTLIKLTHFLKINFACFRTVLYLNRTYIDSTESSHISQTQFPLILIIYITMVHLLQLMNQTLTHYYLLEAKLH